MNWDRHASDLMDACLSTFGLTGGVIYKHRVAGTQVNVMAVRFEPAENSEPDQKGRYKLLSIKRSELLQDPENGDLVVIGTSSYRVVGWIIDDAGCAEVTMHLI